MRTVLITGGARGIGWHLTAGFLADPQYQVVVCARNTDSLAKAENDFADFRDRLTLLQADVGREEDVERMIKRINLEKNSLHVLINNAGIYGPIGDIADISSSAWLEAVNINLMGVFYTCKHAVPLMRKTGFGRIINLSGGGATKPMPGYSAYCSTKAAVVRFSETLAQELHEDGIFVNSIAPGFIATDIHQATLKSRHPVIGSFLQQTEAKMKSGGDDPNRAVKLALHLASEKCTLSGKLISAIHDPWDHDEQNFTPNYWTLRRIDDVFYREIN